MRARMIVGLVVVAVGAAAGAGVAAAAGGSGGAVPSRLDDGTSLLPQAHVSEAQAITAAQGVAEGALNEVDLERRDGRVVFNVDVGNHDVKVDASNAAVVAVDDDD